MLQPKLKNILIVLFACLPLPIEMAKDFGVIFLFNHVLGGQKAFYSLLSMTATGP